ncbi:type VI secretion system baseplate subunit TssE [Haloferula sp. BvORR071]|uniref:type VI secretion system baseplate subunit TssE n=1 Tax=Haloferula sp. BvORR071 TaxID=1396141 RepID=UPI000696FAC2|nr:type VI secretion system baseplate subunit TssE [Haloferula sp. BvORR071]
MNRRNHQLESGVLPCLFDRIVRSLGRGTPESRQIDSRVYRDAIRRDLEWLLNSKRRRTREELDRTTMSNAGKAAIDDAPSIYDHEELPLSVINYGIRDFNGAAVNPDDARVMEGIRSEIRDAIKQFEPRIVFDSLKIEPIQNEKEPSILAFSIEAELWALPEWESLRIDIDLNTGSCQVKDGGVA